MGSDCGGGWYVLALLANTRNDTVRYAQQLQGIIINLPYSTSACGGQKLKPKVRMVLLLALERPGEQLQQAQHLRPAPVQTG